MATKKAADLKPGCVSVGVGFISVTAGYNGKKWTI